jgi:hypothetical protein
MKRRTLTLERLREVLIYEEDTGLFRWKIQMGQRGKVGEIAGHIARGYRRVMIDRVTHEQHQLAWLYVNGVWPEHEIDHINGDKADNRIVNLRDAPHSINTQNTVRPRADNRLQLMGVKKIRGAFVARIMVNKKSIHLGCFDCPSKAANAYLDAKRRLHEGNTI